MIIVYCASIMNSDKEEQFPFQDLIEALSDQEANLRQALKPILKAITKKNIYWAYSVFSTLLEILKSKQEEPLTKYPVVTFFEVYLLPFVLDVAIFRSRKTPQQTEFYFQNTLRIQDSPDTRRLSFQFVSGAIELIYYAAKIKPYRTVQGQQLKQPSNFAQAVNNLQSKQVAEPTSWNCFQSSKIKDSRKRFLQKLGRFGQESQQWTQFLLVNMLEQVKSGKKDLLQLRLLLAYGDSFLTSAVINLCEDELTNLFQQFEHKRKYLALLNQLVRNGDMEAIIMIKNSDFMPGIAARVSQVQGWQGVNKGQGILPEVSASKQQKRQFYIEFLRCLENWSQSMPADYDADHFNVRDLYKFLKIQRKFKFPDNLHLARFQKQINQNLQKNKERNAKLIEILQNMQESKQSVSVSRAPVSKMSNILQQSNNLAPSQLQKKIQQANVALKNMFNSEEQAQKAFKVLIPFKDNWIMFLQALDLQAQNEAKLQQLVIDGQQCVEKIQLVMPHYTSLCKGKISFKQFKEITAQILQFRQDVSANISQSKQKSINKSRSALASKIKSRMGTSKVNQPKSKLGGKELLQKIKGKSRLDSSKMDSSKVMDRSQMLSKSKSKIILDRSRPLDVSRQGIADKSTTNVVAYQTARQVKDNKSPFKKKAIEPQSNSQDEQIQIPLKTNINPSKHSQYQQKQSVNKAAYSQKNSEHKVQKIEQKSQRSERSPQHSEHKGNPSKNSISKHDQEKPQMNSRENVSEGRPSLKASGYRRQQKQAQKIVRIDDYQPQPQSKRGQQNNTQNNRSGSRDKGSRLLARRSANKDSKISQPGKSRISLDRQSSNSQGKRFKETSIAQLSRTKKVVVDIESELKQQKVRIDETIQVNGNVYKDADKRKSRALHQEQFDKFRDDVGQISSIHSNSMLQDFHNSAQKILLNITARQELNNQKQVLQVKKKVSQKSHQPQTLRSPATQQVSSRHSQQQNSAKIVVQVKQKASQKVVQPQQPLVGDYYLQSAKMSPLSPRKPYIKMQEYESKQYQQPQFKNIFAKKGGKEQTRHKEDHYKRKQQWPSPKQGTISKKQQLQSNTIHKYKLEEARSVQNKTKSVQRRFETEKQLRQTRPTNKQQYSQDKHLASSRSIDTRAVQNQKNKEISMLQKKIRQLQKQSMMMKTKLTAMDNQLRSIKSRSNNGSQRGGPQFTAMSQSNAEKSSLRGSSTGRRKGQMTVFQRDIQNGFRQYLQKIKGSTFRKSLLKLKCLVHKTDQLQIGCLSQRGQNILESTLYITPHRYDLIDFTLAVIHDSNLRVKAVPDNVKRIACKKQQKVHLTIQLIKIPFCLPQIEINYKAQSEYSSNYNRLTLPLSFNKFCQIKPLQTEEHSDRHIGFVRSDNFKLNSKVVKLDKLSEVFSSFATVPPTKDRPQTLVAASCSCMHSRFNILINLHQKSSWIQGFLKEGDLRVMNFLLCTFKETLDASKK